ncbi:NADH-quinone oxidoreductase subunit N [Isosphaeraceae bacterium EP7]
MTATYALEVAHRTLIILAPEIILLAVATAMMTAGAFIKRPRHFWSILSAGTLVFAIIPLFLHRNAGVDIYASTVLNDPLSGYSRLFFLLTGLIVLALAHDQVDDARAPEFFGSLLMIHAGAMIVAASNELVLMFVGLELISIPTYLLLYLLKRTSATQEAATKYFFLSIFSSALLLYGMAYLYGLTGVSNLKGIANLVEYAPGVPNPQLALIALVFIMAGLGFRVAAVPFHFYAPDVYQASPTILTAVLAWIPKAVGFLAIIRILICVLAGAGVENPTVDKAITLAWIIAAITMTLGNTVALGQENLKRLFAYSSIAHAGYLMIGVAVAFRTRPGSTGIYLGIEGILFYLFAYALMTLGAFGVILAANTGNQAVENVDDLSGLGQSQPLLALAMTICLFSLVGIPGLAGFWGKFSIFGAAFSAGPVADTRMLQVLTVIAVLNSAAGAYYYLRIVVNMYLKPARIPHELRIPLPTALAIGACASLTLILGIFPGSIIRITHESAVAALSHPVPESLPAGEVAPVTVVTPVTAR